MNQVTVSSPLNEINDYHHKHQTSKHQIKASDAKQRASKLKTLEKCILAHRKAIADALYSDFRKPEPEADLTEIYPVVSECRHVISHLSEWMQPREVVNPISYVGTTSYVLMEPKGSTLIIAPWNYPFYLCMGPLITAVAAGNAVILKPSEHTPATAKVIETILSEVFSIDDVAVVNGGIDVSSHLLQLKFDHIFFTGSPAVGKIVMKAAAEHLCSVTLELGGKSPAIIDQKIDIPHVAKKIVWGKLLNSGQTCIAVDYLLVHNKIKTAFQDEICKQIDLLYRAKSEEIADCPDICRIINQKNATRLKELIDDSIEKGAKLLLSGAHEIDDRFVHPTVITDVPKDALIMQEEIFGPILPIIGYDSIEEAIELINSYEKPLALYIFTKSNKLADQVFSQTSAGTSCMNDLLVQVFHHNLPFGGANNSGIGKSHGWYGFSSFSNERAVLKQHLKPTAVELMYPPYTPLKKKLIDLSVKYF